MFLLLKLNNNVTNPITKFIIICTKARVETNNEMYVKTIYDD